MSSLSTIRSHFPSWGPTQTQGSRCGAGSVHFRSSGSQSGPMPADASAATASSRLAMLAFEPLALHASQRKPSVGTPVALAQRRCRPRQLCGLFVIHGQIFLALLVCYSPLAARLRSIVFGPVLLNRAYKLASSICATPRTAFCGSWPSTVASRALVLNVQPTTVIGSDPKQSTHGDRRDAVPR